MLKFILLGVITVGAGVQPAYGYWGFGTNLGYWVMDADDLKKEKDNTTSNPANAPGRAKVSEGGINWDVEGFYETEFARNWRWGARLGIGQTSTSKLDETFTTATSFDSTVKADANALVIPISLYARYKASSSRLSIFGGAGGDFLMAGVDVDVRQPGFSLAGKFGNEKLAPHIVGGLDFFLTRTIALGLNVKYLFAAVVDDFRSNITGTGVPSGEYRMIMISDPPYGEAAGFKLVSSGLAAGERLAKADFGGARINLAIRFFFGER